MRTLVVCVPLLIGLTACGGGSGEEAAAPTPKPVAVSLQTTCDRLFSQGDPRLWSRATALVAEESQGHLVDRSEIEAVKSELETIAETSRPEVQQHVTAMADTVGDLAHADTSAYKTAATEVANACTPYVAFD